MNKNRKFRFGIAAACAALALVCSATASQLLIPASAGKGWEPGSSCSEANPFGENVYSWTNDSVDGNGWTTKVSAGDWGYGCATHRYTSANGGTTTYTTANQSGIYNSTRLSIEDGKSISLTYTKTGSTSQGNSDFNLFFVPELYYKQDHVMRFDMEMDNAHTTILRVKGDKITVKGTNGEDVDFTNLSDGKPHEIDIYIGTNTTDDVSWVSVDGIKKNTPLTTRDQYQLYTDMNTRLPYHTAASNYTPDAGKFGGYLGMHTSEGYTLSLSRPVSREIAAGELELDYSFLSLQKAESVTLTPTLRGIDESDAVLSFASSDERVATVDQDGAVTGEGEGTATVTVTATVGASSLKQTCNVRVSSYDDPNGWMTTETSSSWSTGIYEGTYDYFTDSKMTYFGTGDCCYINNKTALDLTKVNTFTMYYNEAPSSDAQPDPWTMIALIPRSTMLSALRVNNETPHESAPLRIAVRNDRITKWDAANPNIWGDSTDAWTAETRKLHTVSIYIGEGESDPSFVAVDGVISYNTLTRSKYASGDSFVGYLSLISSTSRAMQFSAIEAGAVPVLDQTAVETKVGAQPVTLRATVFPESGESVVWTSSNEQIATVGNGVVTLAGGAGTVEIRATIGSSGIRSAVCTLKVDSPVKSVALDKTELTLKLGQGEKLTATINPADATLGTSLAWSSSNTSVATVDKKGMITAISVGTTTITVACGENGEITASCTVTVVDPAVDNPDDNGGGNSNGDDSGDKKNSGCKSNSAGLVGIAAAVALFGIGTVVEIVRKKRG